MSTAVVGVPPVASGALGRGAASALTTLGDVEQAPLRPAACPTGFSPLDAVLGGGIGPGDFVLLGGKPGQGKTITALQWAANVAAAGHVAVYACYEHDRTALLARLLACQLGEEAARAGCLDEFRLEGLRAGLRAVAVGNQALRPLLDSDILLGRAEAAVRSYGDRLVLVAASGNTTDVGALAALMAGARGRAVLFVDYLQKVPVRPDPSSEAERVTRVTEALRELAQTTGVAVVGIVAADQAGLLARRLRLHHFRGSTALAYEPDVVIVLNDKLSIVSRVHLAYDTTRAVEFGRRVVFTIEKNRNGAVDVDLEFRKDFANYRFHPDGARVAERLWSEGSVDE